MILFNIRNQTIGEIKMTKIIKSTEILIGLFITAFVAIFLVPMSSVGTLGMLS